MDRTHVSPILDARSQVAYLHDSKNVSFELMAEPDAVAFLEEKNFFFKLKAFAKNFEQYNRKPGEKGRYIHLDFGHLVELSKLDKVLRSLILDLTLDIEHYIKVRINAAAMRSGTDPISVVDSFIAHSAAGIASEQARTLDESAGKQAILSATAELEACRAQDCASMVTAANRTVRELAVITGGRDPQHIEHAIRGMAGSPYAGALVHKYPSGQIPLWTLLELVSFGPLSRFYRHCFGRTGIIPDPEEQEMLARYGLLLACVQQLRNAAAHNDCLLNGLSKRGGKNRPNSKIRDLLISRYGLDSHIVSQVKSVRIAMDLGAVLICYDAYVPKGGSRLGAGTALAAAKERFRQHASWFSKTYDVIAFLEYADCLFGTFSRVLAERQEVEPYDHES